MNVETQIQLTEDFSKQEEYNNRLAIDRFGADAEQTHYYKSVLRALKEYKELKDIFEEGKKFYFDKNNTPLSRATNQLIITPASLMSKMLEIEKRKGKKHE